MPAIASMTGFGSASGEADWGRWSIEAKSVNGRGLDVRVNVPYGFESLERSAKSLASERFQRGNLQIAVRLEPTTSTTKATIDTALLNSLIATVHRASGASELTSEAVAQLLQVRGVVEAGAPDLRMLAGEEAVVTALNAGLETALDGLAQSRSTEGASLLGLLQGLIRNMREETARGREVAAGQPDLLRERLLGQLDAIDARDKVEADRLAVEVALTVAKVDVREELERLTAHYSEAERLLDAGSPVGRKLDFLSQEIGREANTLCSKSASLDLTNIGLALKALNDQFKEQAANVE